MAPPSGLHQSALPSDFEDPFPTLVRSSTAPTSLNSHHRADKSRLAPEDAFHASPPRHLSAYENGVNGTGSERPRRPRHKDGSRSRSRRRKRFQKLLWVKQSYPDNYTDQATFLENLKRNPRLQPYEFWPLVADSTVIVQHVCSVIIFVVCFVGIFQERVSPISVVGWGSFATFVGWLLWDWWVGREAGDEAADGLARSRSIGGGRPYRDLRKSERPSSLMVPQLGNTSNTSISSVSNVPSAASSNSNLPSTSAVQHDGHQLPQRASLSAQNSASSASLLLPRHGYSTSATSLLSNTSQASGTTGTGTGTGTGAARVGMLAEVDVGPVQKPSSPPSPADRNSLRLATFKSAVLIYFTLLGLSPILKSLTRSTSSDSIWAMSFWLLAINIFFADYSSVWTGVHRFPVASLSTNAALMASTVLASRLPSTGQVFSLTLFSIEVFGLFPVFRRLARHRSWRYHVALTALLVLGAGGGVGMIIGAGPGDNPDARWWWPWRSGLLGMLAGCLMAALAMGGCSWWLIGLQKYKNEIYGPWDPARPIIMSRRHWDDE